jgi:hypothetical protein
LAAGDTAGTRRWRPELLDGSDRFRQHRDRWVRVDAGLRVASCNAMDVEHITQRIVVLSSGGADARIIAN